MTGSRTESGRRAVVRLLIALAGGLVAIFMQGQWLLPPDFSVSAIDFKSPWSATITPAFAEGLKFAMTQLKMVVLVPFGGWREDWALWPPGARFELTMLADFGWIASFTYILSRLRAWSSRQVATVRPPLDARSRWLWLRLSLPVLVGGDCIENLSTMVALDLMHPMTTWHGVVLWIGSVASVLKWSGALGCVAMALLGVVCALRNKYIVFDQ
ncbi:MAG: hypothetical protein JWQ11_2890 [Rhizobacter sp.]|nr:hypothetical protein [Rhizobacter sp.]